MAVGEPVGTASALSAALPELPSGAADPAVTGEEPPGEGSGLGWRTRMQYAVAPDGRLGFHRHRSDVVLPVDECPIAHPALQPDQSGTWPPGGAVEMITAAGSEDVTVMLRRSRRDRELDRVSGPATVRETVADRSWTVPAAGFWQVHPAAAATFTATVRDLLQPTPQDRVWDLYGGAGLFAAFLAPHCGPVTVVESSRSAVHAGRGALADLPNVRFVHGEVAETLSSPAWRTVDLVVLDPPRAGAGRDVVEAITRRQPRAVAYVACDPAALARDLRTFADLGYRLDTLRAFDAFPHTHHIECIALLLNND